jgi:hypothetical protein
MRIKKIWAKGLASCIQIKGKNKKLTFKERSSTLEKLISKRRLKRCLNQQIILILWKALQITQERSRVRMQTCIPRPPM